MESVGRRELVLTVDSVLEVFSLSLLAAKIFQEEEASVKLSRASFLIDTREVVD